MSTTTPPPVAEQVFGDRFEAAVEFARLLATDGVERGLIGPREADRLWDRHLLNCAVVAEAIPHGARVGDLGSGAGLPGVPLALARPDLRVDLIEPMSRRTVFLDEVVDALGLTAVRVVRARAEDAPRDAYDVVTARAVAPLTRLVPMSLPLAKVGGALLALKGSSAEAELADSADAIAAAYGRDCAVLQLGIEVVDPPTTVVSITRGTRTSRPARATRHA